MKLYHKLKKQNKLFRTTVIYLLFFSLNVVLNIVLDSSLSTTVNLIASLLFAVSFIYLKDLPEKFLNTKN